MSRRLPWVAWLAWALSLLLAAPALAHKPSDSYLGLDWQGERLSARWDIALRDLDAAIGLDADGDGRITWGEVRTRHADIAAHALAHLAISADGRPCRAQAGEQLVDDHTDGAYTVLPVSFDCAGPAQVLELRYTLFATIDPSHRGLLRISDSSGTRSAVLDPLGPPQRFERAAGGRAQTAWQFAREGVWHIWIGFDHILFLLALLLPAVLVRTPAGWQGAERLRDPLIDVAKIVTAFTLAHSITLSLATLDLVSLPSALVESAIALSVLLAALNNLFPLFQGRRWVVAFAFGLVHGFGFATVLKDLQLPADALLLALLAFNVGVELGQLAIVAVFVPLAFELRRSRFYRVGVLQAGSWAIAALAAVWFAERAFGVELLGL